MKVILDSDNGTEEDTGIKQIVFYGLTSFFCILTAIGLIYLCKTHCCRFQCCADLEKKDDNQVYGEYGDQDVMEVGVEVSRPTFKSVGEQDLVLS